MHTVDVVKLDMHQGFKVFQAEVSSLKTFNKVLNRLFTLMCWVRNYANFLEQRKVLKREKSSIAQRFSLYTNMVAVVIIILRSH